MIIVRITSGLGNQMYQYNFYKFIKEMYPQVPVKADVTWFYANDEHHGFELERIFKHDGSDFELDIASTKEIYKVTGQVPNFCKKHFSRQCQFLLGPINRILREKIHKDKVYNKIDRLESERTDSFIEDITNLDITKDWYLFGFWIEEEYFRGRLDKVLREFDFPGWEGDAKKALLNGAKKALSDSTDKMASDDTNKALSDEMDSVNSVSLHVRRGDYLSATYSGKFKVLGRDYYEKAVSYIREKVENPRFYIFSDDAEFVKKEFDWIEEKVIVDNNRGNDSFRDMQLMSKCKHNIIANSTFSQWGALLNRNEGHITIYPSAYMTDEDSEVKTIEGWIRI